VICGASAASRVRKKSCPSESENERPFTTGSAFAVGGLPAVVSSTDPLGVIRNTRSTVSKACPFAFRSVSPCRGSASK
jgi:hypothetical protein